MRARRRLVPPTLLAAASIVAPPTRAAAEDAKIQTADGPTACSLFEAKNEKELTDWQKQQPAVPYRYPREEEVANAPWGRLFDSLGSTSGLLVATFVPHAGAQLRADTPAAVVSWPWSFPIGPAYTCSRRVGTFNVDKHRAHRLMLEPGIVSGRGVGVFVRPAYRFVHHPSDWVVGVGGGLGSTVEIAGNREPFRASVGPEVLLHFGHCCEPSYFTFAVRYDRFFTGTALDIVTATLGYTFF